MKKIKIYRDSGPVDTSELDKFELMTGYRFPRQYRELLSKHNALYPQEPDFTFVDQSTGKRDIRDITFFGFGDLLPDYSRITFAQGHDIYGHQGLVTFGISANGDYICFDYRHASQTNHPKIVVMLHDRSDETNKMLVNFIAESFEEFVDMLHKF